MNDKPYNPWREFIENVINGDNFFRTQEYYDLLDDIDARIAKEAEQDARIAELTAEVALQNQSMADAFVDIKALGDEVFRLRGVLNKIGHECAVSDNHSDAMARIARNALKDGV